MTSFFAPGGAGEILPRISFLEPLLHGRRVLEIGGAGATEGASALLLAERGAASVLSLDEAGAAGRAARAVTHPVVQFRSADPAHLPAGAFDLVLVHDGLALVSDPAALAALRERLAPAGVLVTAIPAPYGPTLAALAGAPAAAEIGIPSYEQVAAFLAASFPVVEAASQAASVGYAVASGSAGEELPVVVDGSLAPPGEPAFYLFLCARVPTGLRGISLVPLPPRELWDRAHGDGDGRPPADDASRVAEEAELIAAEAARLAGAARAAAAVEVERLESALARAYEELHRAGDAARQRTGAAESDRAAAEARAAEAERADRAHAAELARLRDEFALRGAELVEARKAAEERAQQVEALAAELEEISRRPAPTPAPDPRVAELGARVRELEEALARAEQAQAEARPPPPRSTAPGDPPGALETALRERDAYAQQLAERDARIVRLQREIADKAERIARLAQDLATARSRGALGKLFHR